MLVYEYFENQHIGFSVRPSFVSLSFFLFFRVVVKDYLFIDFFGCLLFPSLGMFCCTTTMMFSSSYLFEQENFFSFYCNQHVCI
jgi:glucose uptake protein GlcU